MGKGEKRVSDLREVWLFIHLWIINKTLQPECSGYEWRADVILFHVGNFDNEWVHGCVLAEAKLLLLEFTANKQILKT